MLQLHNSTPFAADIAIFPNERGIDTLYTIVKATFDVGSQLTLAQPQDPLVSKDEYRAEPQYSSLLKTSDYHLSKPGTDVLIIGDCLAPEGKPTRSCDVEVRVGPLTKTLRIFGDRIWDSEAISTPRTFERMPLIYEHAFGGSVYEESGAVLDSYSPNPVGLGFASTRTAAQMSGERLPNVEDPAELIQSWRDRPAPAGLGPIAPFWPARSRYAGTYDDHWQSTRAPYLPMDFDSRFFHCASSGLSTAEPLQGGEPVWVSNMTAAGSWRFSLPSVALVGYVDWRKQTYAVGLALETVVLRPNQARVTMTWRGALTVNQHALQVTNVNVKMLNPKSAPAQ